MPLEARSWGWRHAGRATWAVRDATFSIPDGQRVLLLGASGAGKSTLLHALAGVLGGSDEGEEAGQLLVDGQHPTRRRGRIGLVLQDPEAQVVLARVGDDVAFGCENMGVPPDRIWPRVRRALDAVGLDVSLDRPTTALSGGQKQRLALAGALAMQARVLLLDEPTANLDPEGVREVRSAVEQATEGRQTTLVVVEHRVEVWADLVDRVVVLAPGGGLLADGNPDEVFADHRDALLAAGVWVPGARSPALALSPAPVDAPALLSADALTIGHEPGRTVQEALNVSIPAGTSTVVTGANGAGKSTLALTLAGLLPALSGQVVAHPGLHPAAVPKRWWERSQPRPSDPATWASRDLLTRIGTVFQHPEHQFVASTVREELAVGLQALARVDAQWSQQRVDAWVAELLALLHLEPLAGANPFTLSGGEKRRLSVGTVLATGPQVIFLDEPTFGQDRSTWLDMVQLVRGMVTQGRAVVSVTHDADYLAAVAQHTIHLERGAHV